MKTTNKPTGQFVSPLLVFRDLKVSTYYLIVFFKFLIWSDYAHTNCPLSICVLARCCLQSIFVWWRHMAEGMVVKGNVCLCNEVRVKKKNIMMKEYHHIFFYIWDTGRRELLIWLRCKALYSRSQFQIQPRLLATDLLPPNLYLPLCIKTWWGVSPIPIEKQDIDNFTFIVWSN